MVDRIRLRGRLSWHRGFSYRPLDALASRPGPSTGSFKSAPAQTPYSEELARPTSGEDEKASTTSVDHEAFGRELEARNRALHFFDCTRRDPEPLLSWAYLLFRRDFWSRRGLSRRCDLHTCLFTYRCAWPGWIRAWKGVTGQCCGVRSKRIPEYSTQEQSAPKYGKHVCRLRSIKLET